MTLTFALQFSTEPFEHRSSLPQQANAGNRFYRRDVAGSPVQRVGGW